MHLGAPPDGVSNHRCGKYTQMENKRAIASIYADIRQTENIKKI